MTLLEFVAYLADAWILAAYARSVIRQDARPFHWANAVGCLPIIGVEVITEAWPALVLTAFFGVIGIAGLLHGDFDDDIETVIEAGVNADELHGDFVRRDGTHSPTYQLPDDEGSGGVW